MAGTAARSVAPVAKGETPWLGRGDVFRRTVPPFPV